MLKTVIILFEQLLRQFGKLMEKIEIIAWRKGFTRANFVKMCVHTFFVHSHV